MDNETLQTTAQTPTAPREGQMNPAYADRRKADMLEFAELFPEIARDPQSIPQEVWDEVRRGRSLVGAYVRYLLTLQGSGGGRRGAETAARSTGSMRSAESGLGGRDAFLQGFLD